VVADWGGGAKNRPSDRARSGSGGERGSQQKKKKEGDDRGNRTVFLGGGVNKEGEIE